MGKNCARNALDEARMRPHCRNATPGQHQALPVPSEEAEQTCLFRWAHYMSIETCKDLKLLHAIPNGGLRSKTEAARMKAAGVRAGVPDVCLPVARKGCHGLYIELKRRQGGRISPEQMSWMYDLTAQGYRCMVCKGWEEAAREIAEYMDLPEGSAP